MDARKMNHSTDLAWMIDASHNVKDPLEDLLQSVEAIMISYAQALIIDRQKLVEAQNNNDVVTARRFCKQAFSTDVRAIGCRSEIACRRRFRSFDVLPERKCERKIDQRERNENFSNRIVRNVDR